MTPAAAYVSLDGKAPTARNLSAPMTARTRAVVWMANVTALRVLVGMTVVLSCVSWTAVSMATVSTDPAFVRRASLVRTAARPTASTTAWAADAAWKMTVFATSHGQALIALNSSVQMTAMIADAALTAPAIVTRATAEKTAVNSLALVTVTSVACVLKASVCARPATVERIAQSSPVPRTAMREAIASMENVSVIQDLRAKIAPSSHALTIAATGASALMENAYAT